jgi:hypothetical protein
MNNVSVKSKKFDFKGSGITGTIVLTDGTKTKFHITESGDVVQQGNTNEEITNPIIYGFVEMLLSTV